MSEKGVQNVQNKLSCRTMDQIIEYPCNPSKFGIEMMILDLVMFKYRKWDSFFVHYYNKVFLN